MDNNFITPTFLLPRSTDNSDYRPVVNSTGTAVIFERSPTSNPEGTNLYILDLTSHGQKPMPFLKGSPMLAVTNRADLCWTSDNVVAFNYMSGPSAIQVGLVPATGINPTLLTNTTGMLYPTWFPSADGLAVDYSSDKVLPNPNTSIISTTGSLTRKALAGPSFWAGMPSVNQISPNLVAFAGQPYQSGGEYLQDFNYIWVVDTSQDSPSVVPLETGVPTSGPFAPQFQARAPRWSPDGKWVAFESNRASQPLSEADDGLYSIFLYEYGGTNPAIQLTDPVYNMQHAKWFQSGFFGVDGSPTLIVASYQPGSAGDPPAWPFGLATLDVSSFVPAS